MFIGLINVTMQNDFADCFYLKMYGINMRLSAPLCPNSLVSLQRPRQGWKMASKKNLGF